MYLRRYYPRTVMISGEIAHLIDFRVYLKVPVFLRLVRAVLTTCEARALLL
jgi:hypothetical protein